MNTYKYYAGLDQHHKMTRLIVIDPAEQIKVDVQIEHKDREQVKEELSRLIPGGALVALEATGFWYWMNDLLEDLGYDTILVHAKEVAEIAKSKKKTDRKDALIMAKLAKDGRLHKAYKMPREIRPLRDLLRHRMELVEQTSRIKNQIHAVLHKQGIWHTLSDLFGARGEVFLDSTSLPEPFMHIVKSNRQVIYELRERLGETWQLIEKLMPEDKIIKLLKTIPGIGPLRARILRYEIWDIDRFERFDEFMSYVGMAPSTFQSAQTLYQGGITHEGNEYVRHVMVEAAQRIRRTDSYLYCKFHRLKKRKGRNKARVAVACDLLQAVYYIWKREEVYRPKPAPEVVVRMIKREKEIAN